MTTESVLCLGRYRPGKKAMGAGDVPTAAKIFHLVDRVGGRIPLLINDMSNLHSSTALCMEFSLIVMVFVMLAVDAQQLCTDQRFRTPKTVVHLQLTS